MPRPQDHRAFAIQTLLGPDVLLLRSIEGREELGRLFEYQADMVSKDDALPTEKLLGQHIHVRFTPPGATPRTLSAVVSKLERLPRDSNDPDGRRLATYRATLVPWFWLLTRSSDCRIFQKKKVPDIIKEVVGDFGFDGVLDLRLTGVYRDRLYCVQYRESAFNFLSRLMEEEGMYYYFEHRDGHHYMVVCDAPASHAPAPGLPSLVYKPHAPSAQDRDQQERVWAWSMSEEVRTTEYATTDYNFRRPSMNLHTHRKAESRAWPSRLEVYDYPGGYLDRDFGHDHRALVRHDELLSCHTHFRGHTNSPGVAVGFVVTLDHEPVRNGTNPQFLVTSTRLAAHNPEYESTEKVSHRGNPRGQATRAGDRPHPVFESTFEVIPALAQFRAASITPKPVVKGSQTAIVTGAPGYEVYIDRHARVKIHFHWDRRQPMDHSSSCWVRVNQPWAGKGFGGLNLPRIGQEVIVDFLEGDPDQPIITGRVYNGESPPPVSKAGKDVQESASNKRAAVPMAAGGAGRGSNVIASAGSPAPRPAHESASPATAGSAPVQAAARLVGGSPSSDSGNGSAGGVTPHGSLGGVSSWAQARQEGRENSAPVPTTSHQVEGKARFGDSLKSILGTSSGSSHAANDHEAEDGALGPGAMEAFMMTSLKSNSLGGHAGSNEITMDDTGGGEKLFIHAQHDEVHVVGNNRLDQVGVDEVLSVGNNKSEEIGVNAIEKVGTAKVVDVGKTLLIRAGVSITLQCGASTIHMNQAGFITISGMVINIAGGVNCNMAAPMTNIVGGILMTTTGAINLSSGALNKITGGMLASVSGAQTEVLAGANNVINGGQVLINC